MIENIESYSERWQNGVSAAAMWDKMKQKFLAGFPGETGGDPVIDQTSYPNAWKVRARLNLGLGDLAQNSLWIGGANNTIGQQATSALGRWLLNSGIVANKIWYASAADTLTPTDISTIGLAALNAQSNAAVTDLWATKATKDSRGYNIMDNYGTDIFFDSNGNVKLKNNAASKVFIGSGIETNANDGLVRLTGGKIPLKLFPDAMMGQMLFSGTVDQRVNDTYVLVTLSENAANKLHEKIPAVTTSNNVIYLTTASTSSTYNNKPAVSYADCEGMYFMWTSAAGSPTTWSSERFQTGDWLISVGSVGTSGSVDGWRKIDNTDAVTSVEGNNDNNVDTSIYPAPTTTGAVVMNAGRVRALDTGLPNYLQSVAGNVQFNKNLWALGGVAAGGIDSLAMNGGGGGGGLSGTIIRNWDNYTGNDTEVLGANLGMRGFRMSGASFQINKPAVGGAANWQTEFTLGTSNIPDLPLTKITGTDDLRTIEALTGTGILKRTGNNTWTLRDAAGLRADAGITGDIYTHNYSEFVTAVSISGTNLSVTKNGQATSTAINAATLQGHAADYFATQEAFESAVSTLSSGLGQVLSMAQDNAENISLHDDRISDLESYFDGSSAKYALDSDKVDGHHASEFVGALGVSGNNLTWTRIGGTAQNITVPYASNAGQLGGVALGGLFTILANDNKQLSATIGGVNKKLTLDYAKKSTSLETEPLTNQEFIFRNSPKTIGADSLKLDRILGRTLVWNQIQRYAHNFSSGMISPSNCTVSYSNGVATITGSASSSVQSFLMTGTSATPFVVGHKYIALITYTSTIGAQVYWSGGSGSFGNIPTKDSIYTYKLVATNNYAIGPTGFGFYVDAPQSNWETKLYSLSTIDMTLLYGSEIDGMTNAEILAKFEKDYPNAYYEYNPGQLINNAAEGLETVGFNLWDEKITNSANVDINTGNIYASSNNSCSTNLTPIIPSTAYCLSTNLSSKSCNIYFYDANKNILSQTGWDVFTSGVKTFTTPTNAYYVRFTINSATLAIGEACLNLSDTSKNGTYEPHKRSVLNLHLDNIQVKSPNIWDEVWEVGYFYESSGNLYYSSSTTTCIRSKNLIPVEPNTAYFGRVGAGYLYRIAQFDANGNYLGGGANSNQASTISFTTYANARYIKLMTEGYGTTYNNDICINISDPTFNGKYFPHGVLIFNGLKQAGDIRDEIVGGKYIRRVGDVDLGTLTWGLYEGYNTFYTTTLVNKISADLGNFICSRYVTDSTARGYTDCIDKTVSKNAQKYIRIKDTSYSTVPAFTTAMSGVYLNYELDTYETYELVSPIPTAMPAGTTERRLPEDTSDSVLAPFACDMTYGTNPGDILASGIPWEKIWGKPTLEKGSLTDALISDEPDNGIWFKQVVSGVTMYIRLTVGDGFWNLQLADADHNPILSKEINFGTLSAEDIDAICV